VEERADDVAALAVAAGCSQSWSDMVWATGESGNDRHAAPGALPGADAPVRACVYRVPVGEPRWSRSPSI